MALAAPTAEPACGAFPEDDGSAQSWLYTIKPGDDFWKLHKRYDVPQSELKRLNPGVSSSSLQIGQQIRIPCGERPESVVPYEIEPGDCLSKIAVKLGTTTSELIELNPYLGSPDAIEAGQVIYVPAPSQPEGPDEPELPDYDPARFGTYQVKSGDTLWGISKKLDVSLEDLKKANAHLPSFDELQVGWTLLVPKEQQVDPDPQPQPENAEISLQRFPPSFASESAKAKYLEEARQKYSAVDEHREAIMSVAHELGVDPAFVAAIVSREWNPEKGLKCVGYDGCGRGMMQVDSRFHGDWLRQHSSDWWKPEVNIRKGIEIFLDLKNEVVKEAQRQRMSLDESQTLACSVAAYNCWTKSVTSLKTYGNPDRYTTEGTYSADVLARAEYFRAMGYVF
jgi:LysM repeat protein